MNVPGESDFQNFLDERRPAQHRNRDGPICRLAIVQDHGHEPKQERNIAGGNGNGLFLGHRYHLSQKPSTQRQPAEDHKQAAPKSCQKNYTVHKILLLPNRHEMDKPDKPDQPERIIPV